MSNALAIASVTRLLKDLLNDMFVNGDISGDVGTDVIVSALPPDRVEAATGDNKPPQLNLYLHRITHNPALANCDLPTRDDRHQLVNKPRLALDLHYLLTAYSRTEFTGEILLGYAMEMLHEVPILARDMVRAALSGTISGSLLPPAFKQTDPAKLADQLELIRIAPQSLSMDDMSKLWTAFQTHYRTTVAYTVSVVLIERDLPVRKPLPVLSRGERNPQSGRDEGAQVHLGLRPATPVLTSVIAAGKQPAARLGDRLELNGARFDAGDASVRFTVPENGETLELKPDSDLTPDRLFVTLPSGPPLASSNPLAGTGNDPGSWRVGSYIVEVVLTAAGKPQRVTNRQWVVLAPRTTPTAAKVGGRTRIRVKCEPEIRKVQSVAIVAGQAEKPLPKLPSDKNQVDAIFPDLVTGSTIPVRLRVAGIDSLIVDPLADPPRFDPTQVVTIP